MNTRTPLACFTRIAVAAALCSVLGIGAASAATFQSLVDEGYVSSKMTRNQAGMLGWKLTKGKSVMFCKMSAGVVSNAENMAMKNGHPGPRVTGSCRKFP